MNRKFIWFIVGVFVFRLILSFVVRHGDLNNHMDWGIRFWEYGPRKFYESNVWSFLWPNQPPGTAYMFAGVRKLFEIVFAGFWWINVNIPVFPSGVVSYFETNLYPALLKLPAILADFGIAYILYLWTKKRMAVILWLLNPVIWYNSAVWGQYDAVISFFALLSFYLLLKKKLVCSLLLLVLSFYIKASLLIFVPVWIIVALRQKYKYKEYVLAVIYSLVAVILITLPFSRGNPITWLYELYSKKVFVQQLHLITANAFNLWAALTGIHARPASLSILGLTYKYWSYILYTIFYIPTLVAVARKQSAINVTWALALTSFGSFMLLTNMHERYLYPLFPYLTILVATSQIGNWYYWVIGFIGLLNLYNFWWVPRIDLLIDFLSFGDRLIPRVLGLINFGFFIHLYSRFVGILKSKV